MKLNLSIMFYLVCLTTIAQTTDTLQLYDAYCESSNPHEIDTTIFSYGNDTLYIRNIHRGICAASHYRATVQNLNDTLNIKIINIGGDCTGDCSMGYTIKIKLAPFDTLNLTIEKEKFTVIRSDIEMNTNKLFIDDLIIYPNPVVDKLNVTGQKLRKIVITDLSGNVILIKNERVNTIDLSELTAGIYIVAISTDKYNWSQKFIKR